MMCGYQEIADEELVSAALRGDVDGYIALCRRYFPIATAIGQAVLRDRHLAEDAAQESLARACRELHRLDEPARFRAWLAAICRNEARKILRSSHPIESLDDREPFCQNEKQGETDADVMLVRQAIDILSDDARELLYLKYRNNLSYQAMAELLDTTPQAVHGRLQRARQAVKTFVERHRIRSWP